VAVIFRGQPACAALSRELRKAAEKVPFQRETLGATELDLRVGATKKKTFVPRPRPPPSPGSNFVHAYEYPQSMEKSSGTAEYVQVALYSAFKLLFLFDAPPSHGLFFAFASLVHVFIAQKHTQ
jgi:hypothetical protein